MNEENKCSKKAVVKYAGAFIAWVVGSGFATGQEALQFFSSYGYMSYGVLLINFIGKPYAGKLHVRFDEGVGKVFFFLPALLYCQSVVNKKTLAVGRIK